MWQVMLAAVLLGFAGVTSAGTSPLFTANVTEVLVDRDDFGGCMVKLDVSPTSQANVTCKDDWVSFGCTGEFWPKDKAERAFSMAQLALVVGNRVKIAVSDDKTYNKYCTAQRIHVIP